MVWYKRTFELPDAMRGRRVFLRFGAVDYRCQAYVNGERAGEHTGGYTPFGFDITNLLKEGANELCARVEDAPDCTQPRGKQYWKEGWMGCWYTPVTGHLADGVPGGGGRAVLHRRAHHAKRRRGHGGFQADPGRASPQSRSPPRSESPTREALSAP